MTIHLLLPLYDALSSHFDPWGGTYTPICGAKGGVGRVGVRYPLGEEYCMDCQYQEAKLMNAYGDLT